MLANILTVTSGELNSGSAIKSVTDRSITSPAPDSNEKFYRPTKLIISNATGGAIHFLPFNSDEYTTYNAGTLITDLIPVANNGSLTLDSFKNGEVTKLLVSGTSGHSSNLSIILIQE